MGNVNETHEREAESSDDVESSNSEANTSSHSSMMSEQEMSGMSDDVHLNESIIKPSLGLSTTNQNYPKVLGNIVNDESINDICPENSVNNSSSDSLPLSESIFPTSFDILEESIDDPLLSDIPDTFLTPDVSYEKVDPLQNTHTGTLPQSEDQNIEQTPHDEIPGRKETKPREDKYLCVNGETSPEQVDAESHSNINASPNEKTPPKMTGATYDFLNKESNSVIKPSNSVILSDGRPYTAHINADKSESGMTALAEHFNAISLEETHLAHETERGSEYTSTEASQDQYSPDAGGLSGTPGSQCEADTTGLRMIECSNGKWDTVELSLVGLPDQNHQNAPISRFDPPQCDSEEVTGHSIVTKIGVCAVLCNQTGPPLLVSEDPVVDDVHLVEIGNSQEPACAIPVETIRPEKPSPPIRAHSPPKHTADRPNWALAPDLPPKPQVSSVKKRKRGPRRGKQKDNDTVSPSPRAPHLSPPRRNVNARSEGLKPSQRERTADTNPRATDIPKVASSNANKFLPAHPQTEDSSKSLLFDSDKQIINEPSITCSRVHAPEEGVPPEAPAASQSTTDLHQSASSHARGVRDSTEAPKSEDNTNPISFGHKDMNGAPPSASESAMASVGSSVGLPLQDIRELGNQSLETPENGIDRSISLTSSVTSPISGIRLPKSSWPSLEEEVRFHAINRSFQSTVHNPSKSLSPDEIFIPAILQNSILETDHDIRLKGNNSPLMAVTKTRHLVFDESIAVQGQGARNARVNIPSNRPEPIVLKAPLQQDAPRLSRTPFQSGIPIPTRGQLHRNPSINPRAPRLSVPEERIVHNVSAQTLVSQNSTRTGSKLSQIKRTNSQPFRIRHTHASSHPTIETISSNRNAIFLPEPSSNPSNIVNASAYPARPHGNVSFPPYSYYPTPVINIHENHYENHPVYQPHVESIPYNGNFTLPQREGLRSMNEAKFYSSGSGSQNVRRRLD